MITLRHVAAALSLAVLAAPSILPRNSRTFFMPRSMQSDISVFNASSTLFINSNEEADRFNLSVTAFYEQSANAKDLARYFMLGGKSELVIAGANAAVTPDVSATWLQIGGKNDATAAPHFPNCPTAPLAGAEELYFNQFQSKVSMRPEFRRFGTVIRFFKSFDDSHRFWIDAVFPFIQVQTDLGLREHDINGAAMLREQIDQFETQSALPVLTRLERATSSTMLNALEGLNNPIWRFGKFKTGNQQKAGLADITLKLGYSIFKEEKIVWNVYPSLVIPTGYKPKSHYVFEPIVGNGQHFALGLGTNLDAELYCTQDLDIHFYTNLDYSYLFSNHQTRSYDLKLNGEWSRYLLVFFPNQATDLSRRTAVPGINVFTDTMRVSPGSEINWTNDLSFNLSCWGFHIGYNLWWKANEHVKLKSSWAKQVSIMHFSSTEDNPFDLESYSKATIKDHFIGPVGNLNQNDDGVGSAVMVTADNLDLDSAANPSNIGHKIYGSIGYNTTWSQLPFQAVAGVSYQINKNKKTIQDWGIWFQISLNV